MSRFPTGRAVRGALNVSLLACVVVGLALPAAAGAVPAAAHPSVNASPEAPPPPITSAAWNGVDLSKASTVGSAFTVTSGQRSHVNFSYDPSGAGAAITTARLIVFYFGSQISANSVPASAGKALMNWTLGTYTYLLQGVYRLTASLVAANGSTVWSEGFYINVQAPYHVGSGMTVFLIVLGAVEIWSISTSGGRSARKSKGRPAPPTPWQPTPPPAEAGPAAPEPTPPTTPPEGGTP